jgi:hypothetical protein
MYKLVLKERRLKEEKIGDKYYLYHATVTKADLSNLYSFRQGIRANASKDMAASQGAGFYLFQNKETAIKRLYSFSLVNIKGAYNPFNDYDDGHRLLVTIELDDLNPAKFSLDNELSYNIIINYLVKHAEELNTKLPPEHAIRLHKTRANAIVGKSTTGAFKVLPVMDAADVERGEADALAAICDTVEQYAPEMWHQLERKMFMEADAIKYVGQEIIKPIKLEIYDDNKKVIDVTTKDP